MLSHLINQLWWTLVNELDRYKVPICTLRPSGKEAIPLQELLTVHEDIVKFSLI